MKLKKPLSLPVLMALFALVGACAIVFGVYLLLGLAPALIIGGAGMVAVGLLVDV